MAGSPGDRSGHNFFGHYGSFSLFLLATEGSLRVLTTPRRALAHPQVTFLPYAPFRGIRHVKIGSETLDIRKGADRFSPLVECLGFHIYRLAGSPTPWCVRTGLSQPGTLPS
jgi:hypothetical protein